MPSPYSKLIGRRAVEVRINELTDSGVPVYDIERGLWTVINSSSLVAAANTAGVVSAVSGAIITPAEVTASFSGDGSNLTGVPTSLLIQADSGSDEINLKTDTLTITGVKGITTNIISNSIEISNTFEGLISSSDQFNNLTDSFTGSFLASKVVIESGGNGTVITGSRLTGLYNELQVVNLSIPSASYSAAHMEYVAQREGESRAGVVMASWTNTGISYTDVSHADVNDSYDLRFDVVNVDENIFLRAQSVGSGSGEWTIQVMYKLFPKLI